MVFFPSKTLPFTYLPSTPTRSSTMVMVISLGVAPSTACSPISQHDLLPSSLTGPPPRRIYCSFSFKCSLMLSLSFFLLFSVPCLFRLTPLPRALRRACIRRSRTFLYFVFCATCVLVGLIAFSPHASYHVDFLAGLMLSPRHDCSPLPTRYLHQRAIFSHLWF